MTSSPADSERRIGLIGATGVGVGAIVGGGILALAGAAFAATGPSALVAFALNGVIAVLTALSFAEVASKFPQSGGTYTFAKKVLSVEAAFSVGWVVWFASIVAAALYALGFGQFAAIAVAEIWRGLAGSAPDWLVARPLVCGLAAAATLFYAAALTWKSAGGGKLTNLGKLVVFAVLIVGGFWALPGRSVGDLSQSLQPFFAAGVGGLFQAMGFTFIALQGFDLIAAVGGEIRQPERTIPRAMLLSLGIALLIYLPLLFVVSTVGVAAGDSVTNAARDNPQTIVALAAQNYFGPFGYWMVIVAAILSMLSALEANIFAASRVSLAMSRDRTLPAMLSRLSERRKTPVLAVLLTSLLVVAIVLALPDVAAAGAASSLIFLITFALAHWIAILVRQRSSKRPPPFRTPFFPLVPIAGGLACAALAVYQGIAVPSAGIIATLWLTAGGLLFLGVFAHRARVADASTEAADSELLQLRGRNPLVLVPISNPDNARGLVAVANALAPPSFGRVLLLSVVVAPRDWRPGEEPGPLRNVQTVVGEALAASIESGLFPESLTTVATDAWQEIARVAKEHRCESLLLGLTHLGEQSVATHLEQLMGAVDCDLAVLRAPKGWDLDQAERILVPTGGRGGHDRLLARLLSSFARSTHREVTFLRIMPELTSAESLRRAASDLASTAQGLCRGEPSAVVISGSSPLNEIVSRSGESDLLILGVHRVSRREKLFGQLALEVARQTDCPLLLISRAK